MLLDGNKAKHLLILDARFKIEDAKYAIDSLAAWACIRLDRLQQGYRFLRLVDTKGVATAGMFLVKVEKTIS
jgi:phosphatidylinositol phospholipase C delta